MSIFLVCPILARNTNYPYISSPPDPSKTNLKALCRNKMEIYYVTSFSTLVNFDGLNVSVEPKQRLKERQKTNIYWKKEIYISNQNNNNSEPNCILKSFQTDWKQNLYIFMNVQFLYHVAVCLKDVFSVHIASIVHAVNCIIMRSHKLQNLKIYDMFVCNLLNTLVFKRSP